MNAHFEELAALDALGILSPEEARSLAENPAERAVADEFVEAAALIARSLDPIEPPGFLRARVLHAATEQAHVVRTSERPWTAIAPGVEMQRLASDRSRNSVTLLFRARPGAAYHDHDHRGSEDTFVLEGSCRVGELLLRAGDFLHVSAGARHGAISTEEGCLLLIVSDFADYSAA